MDKAKEIEKTDYTKALGELEDIWKHPRKYKNVIHLLNAVCESSEAVKKRYYE
jgi:ubiquinone biosynthesis protein Coq4